jgi:hypothetical protein
MADEPSGEEPNDSNGTSIDLFGHRYSFVWTESGPTLEYTTDGIVTMTRRKESVIPFVADENDLTSTPEEQIYESLTNDYEVSVRQA